MIDINRYLVLSYTLIVNDKPNIFGLINRFLKYPQKGILFSQI
jgi:hypothetical protein